MIFNFPNTLIIVGTSLDCISATKAMLETSTINRGQEQGAKERGQ